MNELKYPRKFRAIERPFIDADLIVEFTSNSSGTVIKSNTIYWKVGYHSNGWSPCTDTKKWEPVKTLILKRKAITTKDKL